MQTGQLPVRPAGPAPPVRREAPAICTAREYNAVFARGARDRLRTACLPVGATKWPGPGRCKRQQQGLCRRRTHPAQLLLPSYAAWPQRHGVIRTFWTGSDGPWWPETGVTNYSASARGRPLYQAPKKLLALPRNTRGELCRDVSEISWAGRPCQSRRGGGSLRAARDAGSGPYRCPTGEPVGRTNDHPAEMGPQGTGRTPID